jgi:integral membrane sensor domain MASE1
MKKISNKNDSLLNIVRKSRHTLQIFSFMYVCVCVYSRDVIFSGTRVTGVWDSFTLAFQLLNEHSKAGWWFSRQTCLLCQCEDQNYNLQDGS